MVHSIRNWLILSFIAILLICTTAVWLFMNSYNKSKRLETYHSNLKTTRILLLEINKLKEDIVLWNVNGETFDDQFTELENKYARMNKQTSKYIRLLENSETARHNHLTTDIKELNSLLRSYNDNYNELIHLYRLKGFKNYGLEGVLREYAHNVYEYDHTEVKLALLTLRKHEKDFLLRKDLNYVFQFGIGIRKLISVINDADIPRQDKAYLITNTYYYSRYFKMLARIDIKIGVKGRNGILNKSQTIFNEIAYKIENLDERLKTIESDNKEKLKRTTLLFIILLVAVLTSTIILISYTITRSIRSISDSFNNYVNSGFNYTAIEFKRSRISEFNSIFISFLKMVKEINVFTNFFKEKVYERTVAINEQKEEILSQRIKIENHYNDLLSKNAELNEQKQLLSLKNNDIQESLRYAKRIQKAIQPGVGAFRRNFNDYFVFAKARDVVSGDFYLLFNTEEKKEQRNDKVIFVAADCTGHGVPGAIMSVLGINTLNKIIKELNHKDPGKILNLLDKDIHIALADGKKENNKVADGMDIAVFAFDKNTYMLEYSIARFSHFLIRNSEIIDLNTHRTSIGYSFFKEGIKEFKTQSMQLQKGDCLYVFSDGYIDQFGGPKNKKFKKNKFRELILKHHHLQMSDQKEIIKNEFKAWKRSSPQVDDVLTIGIRF